MKTLLLLLLLAPTLAVAAPADAAGPSTSVAPTAPKEPAERRFHVGGGAYAGAASVDGRAVPFYEWRTETGVHLGRGVSVGIAHMIGFGGDSDGVVGFVHGTPFVELGGFVGTRVQPYGRAGILLRGHGDTPEREVLLEAAPYVGGGARVFPTRAWSVGLEVGAHVVVTDALTLGGEQLPRWAVPATATLSTAVHF